MEFKLDVAVEQSHIDCGYDKDPITLAIWDAAKNTPPFRSVWDVTVDLTGITVYAGADPWRWHVYLANCPDQVSEFYERYGHMPVEPLPFTLVLNGPPPTDTIS